MSTQSHRLSYNPIHIAVVYKRGSQYLSVVGEVREGDLRFPLICKGNRNNSILYDPTHYEVIL